MEHIHLWRMKRRPVDSWGSQSGVWVLQPDTFFVYTDTEPPEFEGRFRYVRNMTDSPFTPTAPDSVAVVTGDVDIIVGLRDPGEWTRSKAGMPGVPAGFGNAHAVSRIEYDIAGSADVVATAVAVDFSRTLIARETTEVRKAHLLLLYQHFESAQPRPVFTSNGRYNFYVITNSSGTVPPVADVLDTDDIERSWRTAELGSDGAPRFPNGEYTITVRAYDSKGNMASRSERVRVQN